MIAVYAGSDSPSGGSGTWMTPEWVLDVARASLGGEIELDPMSTPEANERVKAKRFYTPFDNAFVKHWDSSALWLNPPFGRRTLDLAINRFFTELPRIEKAVVITNNVTETAVGQALLAEATEVWFPARRVAFLDAKGEEVKGNPRGQMLSAFNCRFVGIPHGVVGHWTLLGDMAGQLRGAS